MALYRLQNVQRHRTTDSRAATRLPPDFESTADGPRPIVHDVHPQAFGFAIARKADAIVADSEFQTMTYHLQTDQDSRGLAMADSIVEGFLGYAIEMRGDRIIRDKHWQDALHSTINLETRARGIRQFFQR